MYDFLCGVLGYGRKFNQWLTDMIDVKPGQALLDVGCGTGTLALRLLQNHPGLRVLGVDPTIGAIRIAQSKSRKLTLSFALCAARAEQLPFTNAVFDCVTCTLAFHHIPDSVKAVALAEMRRVLRQEGLLLLADFETRTNPFFWGKYRSGKTLQNWLSEAGFEGLLIGKRRGVFAFSARPQR